MVVSNIILSTAVDLFAFTVSAVNCWGVICDGMNNFSLSTILMQWSDSGACVHEPK